MPSVRSVALGFWVRTGSRDEAPEQAGVSHFLEHLLFKGTERHSAIEISELFDGMGAAANAATEQGVDPPVYARFLDEHTEAAFDAARRRCCCAPSLPADDRLRAPGGARGDRDVRGRAVRTASTTCSREAIFGDHPLGRRVLGDAEVIASIPVPEIAGYHHEPLHGAATSSSRKQGASDGWLTIEAGYRDVKGQGRIKLLAPSG